MDGLPENSRPPQWTAYGAPQSNPLDSMPLAKEELAIEKFGGLWREWSGWQTVWEEYHSATELLAIVLKNDDFRAIKAGLFARFDNGCWPKPVWEMVDEAIFGPEGTADAVNYLILALKNRSTFDGHSQSD